MTVYDRKFQKGLRLNNWIPPPLSLDLNFTIPLDGQSKNSDLTWIRLNFFIGRKPTWIEPFIFMGIIIIVKFKIDFKPHDKRISWF